MKLRKRAWQGREVPVEDETWELFSSAGLRAHVDGCPACREEHESLRALVRQDRSES